MAMGSIAAGGVGICGVLVDEYRYFLSLEPWRIKAYIDTQAVIISAT
jgi:hypothetical protein